MATWGGKNKHNVDSASFIFDRSYCYRVSNSEGIQKLQSGY
jgi:hypothetical protein